MGQEEAIDVGEAKRGDNEKEHASTGPWQPAWASDRRALSRCQPTTLMQAHQQETPSSAKPTPSVTNISKVPCKHKNSSHHPLDVITRNLTKKKGRELTHRSVMWILLRDPSAPTR